MRVLLLNPPNIEEDPLDAEAPPLGLLYLRSSAKAAGYRNTQVLNLFGARNWNEVNSLLSSRPCDVIGIPCYSRQRHSVRVLTDVCRRVHPTAFIMVGGPHSSFLDRLTLERWRAVDVVVRGEAERTFCELLAGIGSASYPTAGITFRAGATIVRTPDAAPISNLDSIEVPEHESSDLSEMADCRSLTCHFGGQDAGPLGRIAPILTSRGCGGHCVFCCNGAYWGAARFRSPRLVVDEIESLYTTHRAALFDFYDDSFCASRHHVVGICEEILKRRLAIHWWCSSRVDGVDSELCRLMHSAGCFMISFGVESGSQLILDKIGKGASVAQAVAAMKAARSAGMSTRVTLSVGTPGESEETIRDTCRLLKEAEPHQVGLFLAKLYPGTPLYHLAQAHGGISDEWWFERDNTSVPFFTSENSLEQLLDYQRRIENVLACRVTERYAGDAYNIELTLS